ncbi:hypothetical protein K6V78_08170 [Streptococcus gallolyticus]|uniref:LiaF transmembrane domain-containing protein n=1 Tax=Streptococcus hepaticus TaxID=3349163 RepID=UPI001C93F25D|nr:hypothetical protein [Streptococcus gallolyticus]MBY5041499.1 hypothetical protein [Streptococcus gallolyticus]
MKKKLAGISLIALALLILFKDLLGLTGLQIWPMVWIIVFGVLTIDGMVNSRWYSGVFFAILTFATANSMFDWTEISFWTLVLVGFLLMLGIKLLTQPKHKWLTVNGLSSEKETVFGSATRYVNDSNFIQDKAEVAFGSLSIFFDNAVILGDVADLNIDVAFSGLTLYVPSSWYVDVSVDNAFSSVKCKPSLLPTDKVLRIRGDLAFSSLTVRYI